MTRRARFSIPDYPRDRPTVDQIAPLVRLLYADHAAGCCLHIALDDGNLKDRHIEFCLRCARVRGHALCEQIASAMLKMTPTQRRRL